MSFEQGLSGLNAAGQNLDVIGNNIANSETAGFKSSSATFSDVFAVSLGGGASGMAVGSGTQVAGVTQQFSQGSITADSNPLDVAINGSGFFRVSNGGAISYTRNGQFQVDKNGYLIGANGQNVTGYQAVNGAVITGVLGNLQLSQANVAPKATTTAAVGANLASTAPVLPTASLDPTNPTTYNYSTSSTAYDSLGQSHTVTYYFNKTAANGWDASVYVDGAAANGAGASSLSFDTGGNFVSSTNLVKTAALANGAAPLSITMDFSKMTQTGSAFGVNSLSQDGYASGQLSGYNIGSDGTIVGNYTNGQTQRLGQIALANFTNPQGLAPLGNSMWSETASSGAALAGTPGSASLGALQSSALEGSNVDLTAQLVSMITAQRDYQANAQTIKTQDALTQTLITLR